MENPLVSILIPMYNSENYIEKTIHKLTDTKVRIKSDKQKNVAKLLADRRFRKMA